MDKHERRFGRIKITEGPDTNEYKTLIDTKKMLEKRLVEAANKENPFEPYMSALTNAIGALNKIKKLM